MSGGEEKNGVGAGMIDSMSDEEFNRDRSDENPNVGKTAKSEHVATDMHSLDAGVKIDAVDREMIQRGDRIGAKLVRSLLAHYDANTDLSLRAENERLKQDCEEYKDAGHAYYARALKAEAKMEEAAKVLEPFAGVYDDHLQEHDTAARVGGYVPLEDEFPFLPRKS